MDNLTENRHGLGICGMLLEERRGFLTRRETRAA